MTKQNRKKFIIAAIILVAVVIGYRIVKKINLNPSFEVGQEIDSLNHVIVYYNGGVDHVDARNTIDGYNLGLKYQCIEFVKRYYYEHYQHKMPDSYGHAISFYQEEIEDGDTNTQRDLIQYSNPSSSKPQIGDLIVMEGSIFNKYGHVAIVSNVLENEVEIIQQNPGPFGSSREKYELKHRDNLWEIENDRILGWLRKESD
jgi:surface antigen